MIVSFEHQQKLVYLVCICMALCNTIDIKIGKLVDGKFTPCEQIESWGHQTFSIDYSFLPFPEDHKGCFIACYNSQPVKWTVSGFLEFPPMLEQYYSVYENNNETGYIAVVILGKGSKAQVSATVECLEVNRPDKNAKIFLFYKVTSTYFFIQRRDDYFWEQHKFELTYEVHRNRVLACAVIGTSVKVILKKNGHLWEPTNGTFNFTPTVGFTFNNELEAGRYTCLAEFGDRQEIRNFEITKQVVYPEVYRILFYAMENITFRCPGKIGVMFAKSSDFKNFSVSYDNETETGVLQTGEPPEHFETTFRGKDLSVYCLNPNETFHRNNWRLYLAKPPELKVTETHASCHFPFVSSKHAFGLSSQYNPELFVIKCTSPSECDAMLGCIKHHHACRWGNKYQEETKYFISNIIRDNNILHKVTTVGTDKFFKSGLIHCSYLNKWKDSYFYTDLEGEKVVGLDAKNVSKLMLMRIEPQPENGVVFREFTYNISCTVLKFWFHLFPVIVTHYVNGTVVRHSVNSESILRIISIKDGNGTMSLPAESKGTRYYYDIEAHYTTAYIITEFDPSVVGVSCDAVMLNGSVYELPFQVKVLDSLSPRFIMENSSKEMTELEIGGAGQSLHCTVEGLPRPIVTWNKNNVSLEDSTVRWRTNISPYSVQWNKETGSSGSVLTFEAVRNDTSGVYYCVATSLAGNSSKAFHVKTVYPKTEGIEPALIYGPVLGILAVSVIIVSLIAHRYRVEKERTRELTDEEVKTFFAGMKTDQDGDSSSTIDLDLLPFNRVEYETDLNSIDLDNSKHLGSGQFSYVLRGTVKATGDFVAVKVFKPTADTVLFKRLLLELKIMGNLGGHENVLRMVGASTVDIRKRAVHIFLEYCENGCLKDVLLAHKSCFLENGETSFLENDSLGTKFLLKWSAEIAKGMLFLSQKNIIHADLAARNVLLTKEWVAKIADFGLSKKLYSDSFYTKQSNFPLPWRWMAPESLRNFVYSPKSDVWSFGVILWEIYSLGDTPFPSHSWNEGFVNALISGELCLGKPTIAPSEIYVIMMECLCPDADARPSFTKLVSTFDGLVTNQSGSLYTSLE